MSHKYQILGITENGTETIVKNYAATPTDHDAAIAARATTYADTAREIGTSFVAFAAVRGTECARCAGAGYLPGYERSDGGRCWTCNRKGYKFTELARVAV